MKIEIFYLVFSYKLSALKQSLERVNLKTKCTADCEFHGGPFIVDGHFRLIFIQVT